MHHSLLLLFVYLLASSDALQMKREILEKSALLNTGRKADTLEPYIIELASYSENEEEVYRTQMDFLASMDAAGIKFVQRARFSSFFNAISGTLHSKHLDYLHEMPQVKAIWPVTLHNKHAPIEVQPVDGLPSYLISNTFNSTSVDKVHSQLGNTGAGVKIGIIDSGIDYKHPALGGCFGAGCRVRYGWDFVGDAFLEQSDEILPDPDPMDCSGHGTHVAGIVGANGYSFAGVAPDVVFGAYRVLGCEGTGPTDAIIQAVEMAVKDEMDIINLSLGTNSPFPSSLEARIVDFAAKKGVLVIAAAGNSGLDGQWTIGEPSTASGAISVASFESSTFPGQKMILDQYPGSEIIVGYAMPRSFSFSKTRVLAIEYDGCMPVPLRLDGAIVMLNSKKLEVLCDSSVRQLNAEKAGAVGVIMGSRFDEPNIPYSSLSTSIPVMGVNAKEYDLILDKLLGNPNLTMSTLGDLQLYTSPFANKPSSFSSWGPDFELNLKPDIGAPGGNIYSTYPLAKGGYAYLKGTSMAAPYLAGSSALILRSRREAGVGTDVDTLRSVIISSGVPAFGGEQMGYYSPVGKQGGGLINVWNAIHTTTLVSPQKISLNDTTHANLNHVLTITNTNMRSITYNLIHRPAMSVNGYDDHGLPLKSADFSFSKQTAKVDFSVSEITVEAGQSAQISLQVRPPTFNSLFPWVYSGYIVLTGSDGIPSTTVPYVGVAGNFGDLRPIHLTQSTAPSLTHRNSKAASTSYDFRNGESALLSVPLINPTKKLVIYVTNERTDFIGLLALYSNVGRTFESPVGMIFNGTVILESNGTAEISVLPNGKYHIVVEALQPFTNDQVTRWTSPLMDVVNF